MTDHHHHEGGDWRADLSAMREDATRYYADEFDWRGHEPPAGYGGPRFYPPAEAWRVTARLDTSVPGTGDPVTLPTSTGKLRQMTVAGQLVFAASGSQHRLTAFLTHGTEHDLFVPFRDQTSGHDTYGAGRYIDLPYRGDDAEYLLDFNLAYNPSCAYSPAYDCPYPPPGNRLGVAVEAGEKVPFEHA